MLKNLSIATAAACVSIVLGTHRAAIAATFTVTQENNPTNLLNALLGETTGLSNFTVTANGNAEAFGLFSNDPFGLSSGIVLSTGRVVDIPGENTEDGGIVPDVFNAPNDLSTDFSPDGASGDSTTLNISFDADGTAEKLFFQYVFGSEEFKEFGGSQFNDSFTLTLNGVNLALLSNGNLVTINNLVPNPSGSFNPDYINNPAGTGTETKLDGFTKVLTFEGLLNKNATNFLTINIQDVGDGLLDSAVFIKGQSLGIRPPVEQVPEPNTMLAILALGALSTVSWKQKRHNKSTSQV
ncbi:choice-of-anchor L domain-containing protein [Anabaena sp. CCY 9402-a]|uniref:choice-of-anchor L domain-containing protein n=1 Tax=Anabaena sp. CCY 9402-a TaxID=3103867 RepID=UPI0039C6789B